MRPTWRKVYAVDGGPAAVHGTGPRILAPLKVRQMHDALMKTHIRHQEYKARNRRKR